MGNCVHSDLKEAVADKDFTFDGNLFKAKVVSIYDGDTYRVKFMRNGEQVQYNCRATGYDSPEMKPSKLIPENKRRAEKKAAIEAKEALRKAVMRPSQLVYIKCGKFDKYGRLLVTIFILEPTYCGDTLGRNINEWMIASGYGYPYKGGTKEKINYRIE